MTPLENEPRTNTIPALWFIRARMACSHARTKRAGARTYSHERETRARIPSGVCYGGGLLGFTKGKPYRRVAPKELASEKPSKSVSRKEAVASGFRAIKSKIESVQPPSEGDALIAPVFTHPPAPSISIRQNNKPRVLMSASRSKRECT